MSRARVLAPVALSLALALPLASRAQEEPPPSEAAPAAGPAATIEEIVVTAQKRAQSVQDVPVSVAAIAGDQLEDLKLTDTNDLAGLVPNLQVNQINGDGAPVFSLRGVTMNDYSVHQSSPVAVYTDEVYAGPAVLQPIQMFDLERVEVLRGPQGTLYGRNTTGGAVNLISKAPDFETNGYLTGGYGNFDRMEVRAAAGVPIVDERLAVRLAGYWLDGDGWFENLEPGVKDANSVDEWAVRASALWTPTEGLDITARYSSGRSRGVNYGIFADDIDEIGIGEGADVYDLYDSLGFAPRGDYTRAGLDEFEIESNNDTRRKREVDQASLHVNWDLGEMTVTSVTSWTQGDFLNPEDTDGAPFELLEIDYLGDGDQFSQDFRLTSTFGGKFEFVAGIYWALERLDIATDFGLGTDVDFNMSGSVDPNDCLDIWNDALGLPISPEGVAADAVLVGQGLPNGLADLLGFGCTYRNSFEQERRTTAVYFDGSYELFEDTRLLFGVRVTTDATEVDGFTTFAEGAGVNVLTTIPSVDDELQNTEPTWKVGLEQRLSEDALFYFTYSRGYRSGAFNGQAFFLPQEFVKVDPETLDAIEAGVKSTWLDGRLQLNGAAFYYIYKDQQLIDVDPATLAQLLVNIDETTVLGAEIEALAQVTETLRLSAGVGFLDGEAQEGVVKGIDLEGKELPNTPNWNVHFAGDWDFLRSDYGTASVHFDTGYVSDQYTTLPYERRNRIEGYWLLNSRIAFAGAEDRWEVAFWAKNLTDEWFQTSTVDLAGFGYEYSHIGPPRTYGGEVTFRF